MPDYLGHTINWTRRNGKQVVGRIVGTRRAVGVIEDTKTGERWLGIEFLTEPEDGSRRCWSPGS